MTHPAGLDWSRTRMFSHFLPWSLIYVSDHSLPTCVSKLCIKTAMHHFIDSCYAHINTDWLLQTKLHILAQISHSLKTRADISLFVEPLWNNGDGLLFGSSGQNLSLAVEVLLKLCLVVDSVLHSTKCGSTDAVLKRWQSKQWYVHEYRWSY